MMSSKSSNADANSDTSSLQEEPMPTDMMFDEPEMFGGMLNGILGNYFEYEHGDGNRLNLADILLLIRQSVNENTEAIKSLTSVVKDHLTSKRN
jgi:hypothetical protein